MKLGLMASGKLGQSIVDKLISNWPIEFILTDSNSEGIIELSRKKKILCFAGNPRNGKAVSFVKAKQIDVLLSINYLFIVEDDLISLPEKFAINIHGSLLPKYRGRTPHVWAIINGEEETGITAHMIEKSCDTGDILAQKRIAIETNDTGADLLVKFENIYPNLIQEVLNDIKSGQIQKRAQDNAKATYFGKRTPEDGLINWNWHKERIRNWVRAQSDPYPGAFTYCDDIKITIDKVSYSDLGFHNEIPNGQIVSSSPMLVKSPNGLINIEKFRDEIGVIEEGKILNV